MSNLVSAWFSSMFYWNVVIPSSGFPLNGMQHQSILNKTFIYIFSLYSFIGQVNVNHVT